MNSYTLGTGRLDSGSMHLRWLRMIAAFALLCVFTFVFPLNTAFAEDAKYQKISLTKWSEENCKVIVNNSITENTPFYLEYRNQPDLITWVMGSSLRHVNANSDLVLHDDIGNEFVSAPSENDICIRIPGNISPVDTSSKSFKTVVYAGVGQKGKFDRNNARNFRIDWTVTHVSFPRGIIQKNIEIGEVGTNSSDVTGSSQINYNPLVKGTSLAADMQVDEEEPIMLSFKSAGIYTLTIQADIKYNGVKNSQFVTTYKLVVGNEATFENQTPDSGDNTGSNSGDSGSNTSTPTPDNSTKPVNPPTPGENNTPGTNSTPATTSNTNAGANSNNTQVNPGNNGTNNTPATTQTLPTPSGNNPVIPHPNPTPGNTHRDTLPLASQLLNAVQDNAFILQNQNENPIPAKPPIPELSPIPNLPKNNTESQNKSTVSPDSSPAAIVRANRTVAQEAGLNFLHTAPMLVAGTVIVVGIGAGAALFFKMKP